MNNLVLVVVIGSARKSGRTSFVRGRERNMEMRNSIGRVVVGFMISLSFWEDSFLEVRFLRRLGSVFRCVPFRFARIHLRSEWFVFVFCKSPFRF